MSKSRKNKIRRDPDSFYASHIVSELGRLVFDADRLRMLLVEIGCEESARSLFTATAQLNLSHRQALVRVEALREAEEKEHQKSLERGRDIILALSGRAPAR
jgi:hypothetical protein